MHERGIIKWAPFNTLPKERMFPKVITTIPKPVLSEDQFFLIDINLKECLQNKLNCSIKYYFSGKINKVEGIINYLDINKKYVVFNNKRIYLSQILDIKLIN